MINHNFKIDAFFENTRSQPYPLRLLTLEQYLKVYTASSKDGYRMNVKEKKDHEKIHFIRSQLGYPK